MDLTTLGGFVFAGFVVGSLIGATGVGGGSLMTPLLVMLFGISPSTAVGTDLLFAAVTKGVGTALHGVNRSVSWIIVGRLCAGSIPATLLTLWALRQIRDSEALSALIRTGLGVALVATSAAILLQSVLRKLRRQGSEGAPSQDDAQTSSGEVGQIHQRPAGLTIATGALLGALVTLTSVGAGAVGVMVLMALYPQVRSVKIVGTDIAHAVPLTLLAGLGHASLGRVDFTLLGALLLGSIPGIILGAQLAFRLPERAMRQALGVILMFVGGKLLT